MAINPSSFIESSFLSELLQTPGLTDVSFNGEKVHYVTNAHGRAASSIEVTPREVGDFLRQLANLTERQFSYSSPILDVSFGRYRLNAVYQSLARFKNEKTYTFSLRLASPNCSIDDNKDFFGGNSEQLLLNALAKQESIVVGGKTGTGKTELEKWLLLRMTPATRVIVIDNVEELDMIANPEIDLTTWIANESIPQASFASLIKNSLRNNPDYIVIAEARGAEMLDVITSAMSGHPIISSIHSRDLFSMPERMGRLAMLSPQKLYLDALVHDVEEHFGLFVYLEKDLHEGKVRRYVRSIGRIDRATGKMQKLYEREEAR